MRIIKCDRCGKLIHAKNGNVFGSVSIWKKDASTNATLEENAFAEWDFCEDCMNSIRNFISKPTREEKFEKIIESVDAGKKTAAEPKVKKTKQQKNADWGKAQALRDAGWTVTKISEELGVTKSAVYEHTSKPAQKRRYVNEWAEKEPDLRAQTREIMGEKYIEKTTGEIGDA